MVISSGHLDLIETSKYYAMIEPKDGKEHERINSL